MPHQLARQSSPPADPPTLMPASAAIMGPFAMNGPTPGIAIEPTPRATQYTRRRRRQRQPSDALGFLFRGQSLWCLRSLETVLCRLSDTPQVQQFQRRFLDYSPLSACKQKAAIRHALGLAAMVLIFRVNHLAAKYDGSFVREKRDSGNFPFKSGVVKIQKSLVNFRWS